MCILLGCPMSMTMTVTIYEFRTTCVLRITFYARRIMHDVLCIIYYMRTIVDGNVQCPMSIFESQESQLDMYARMASGQIRHEASSNDRSNTLTERFSS